MDTIKINSAERWLFRRTDEGIDIALQRQAGTNWLSVEWYNRPVNGGPMHAQHYANFRKRFAAEADYRQQFKVSEERKTMSTEQQPEHTQALPEAPASATAKMTSPAGIEWMITCRDFRVVDLLKKINTLESTLLENGWQAAPGRGGHAHQAQASANGNGHGPSQAAPVCQYHGAMKPSTKAPGTWYCTAKMGDGSYCQEKA